MAFPIPMASYGFITQKGVARFGSLAIHHFAVLPLRRSRILEMCHSVRLLFIFTDDWKSWEVSYCEESVMLDKDDCQRK